MWNLRNIIKCQCHHKRWPEWGTSAQAAAKEWSCPWSVPEFGDPVQRVNWKADLINSVLYGKRRMLLEANFIEFMRDWAWVSALRNQLTSSVGDAHGLPSKRCTLGRKPTESHLCMIAIGTLYNLICEISNHLIFNAMLKSSLVN